MSNPTPNSRSLLAWADLLLILADALRRPRRAEPLTPEQARSLLNAAGISEQSRAFAFLAEDRAAPAEPRRREHHRLFEGSAACPVNEGAYIRRDKGSLLADISGFYRAFGLALAEGTGERPDHLRCELEFCASLLLLAAQARETADAERADLALDALRAFLADHLFDWLPSFCAQLTAAAKLPLHARLAEALHETADVLARGLGLPTPPPDAVAAPAEEPEDSSMECGKVPSPTACELTVNGTRHPPHPSGSPP